MPHNNTVTALAPLATFPASYHCIDAGRVGRWPYSLWRRERDGVRKCYIGEAIIDVPPDVSLKQFKQWLADLPAVKEQK